MALPTIGNDVGLAVLSEYCSGPTTTLGCDTCTVAVEYIYFVVLCGAE